ncbi:hypothetical protein [Halorientalis sp.]|uniref:hypothetical protein n=1 Tax=Halorientalis sp. TaxID=1931229 RepID=UPI00262337A9|nr:hypothetical protein [Halorientalis sp.]
MSDERPTVRPVTIARLVETTHLCEPQERTTDDIEDALGVSHRRARSAILESTRISLIKEVDDDLYDSTAVGESFVEAVQNENWTRVSSILETRSPHYGEFVDVVESEGPITLEDALVSLEENAEFTPYSYNQASVEVLGDWAGRLGVVQRNAFSGEYYLAEKNTVPPRFANALLKVYDDMEETAGVGMRQRYLSIPEVREELCSRLGTTRDAFDDALSQIAQQNVGKLELSGAPVDTGAKEASYGIKTMSLADDGALVSTSQSTERVMAGIEQFGKQYYYLTVHDRDLTYTQS